MNNKSTFLWGIIILLSLSLIGCGAWHKGQESNHQPSAVSYQPTTPPNPPKQAKPISSLEKSFLIPPLGKGGENRGDLSAANHQPPLTKTNRSEIQIHLYAGWNTISFPLMSVTSTSGFGYYLYQFNGDSYEDIDPANHPEAIDCTKGYWAYAEEESNVSVTGEPNGGLDKITQINLVSGWNLIGFPYDSAINFEDLNIQYQEDVKNLTQAVSGDIPPEAGVYLYRRIYNCNDGWHQQIASESENTFIPATGYWLWSWQNCQLVYELIPHPLHLEFIKIPGGEFTMGSPENEGESNERPEHTVYVTPYQISKYEITNIQFARFIYDTDYEPEGNWRNFQDSPSNYPDDYQDYPVINVSWNDAQAFCEWAGGSLPTEAQWEKAARSDGRRFPWGNDFEEDNCNNYEGPSLPEILDIDDDQGTCPTDLFTADTSLHGIVAMAGNVAEWCSDWYQSNYYTNSPYSNPTGPETGTYRVIRGGSWYVGLNYCRSALRDSLNPTNYGTNLGFRCVKEVSSNLPVITAMTPSVVLEESTVVITGDNFGDSEGTVDFDEQEAADIALWCDTRIICKVPYGTESGNVTVTTSEGSGNGLSYTVTDTGIMGRLTKDEETPLDVLATFTAFAGGVTGAETCYSYPGDGSFVIPVEPDALVVFTIKAPGYIDATMQGIGQESEIIGGDDWLMLPPGSQPPFFIF